MSPVDKNDEATEIIFSCGEHRVNGLANTSFWRISRQLDLNDVGCDVRPHFISSLIYLFPFCIFGGYGVNQLFVENDFFIIND